MHRVLSPSVLIYLFLLLILDFCVTPVFKIGTAQPFLLYSMVPYVAFQWRRPNILGIALLVGLLRDAAGSRLFGVETASVVMAALLLELAVQKVDRESMISRCGLMFLFIVVQTGISLMLLAFLGFQIPWTWYTLGACAGSAFYTMAAVPFFFFLTARWFGDRVPFKQYELFR